MRMRMRMRMCLCVCVCMRASSRPCARGHMRASANTCIREYVHMHTRTHMHMQMHTRFCNTRKWNATHTCSCAYAHLQLQASRQRCIKTKVHLRIPACPAASSRLWKTEPGEGVGCRAHALGFRESRQRHCWSCKYSKKKVKVSTTRAS